jgi:hypothetical protein
VPSLLPALPRVQRMAKGHRHRLVCFVSAPVPLRPPTRRPAPHRPQALWAEYNCSRRTVRYLKVPCHVSWGAPKWVKSLFFFSSKNNARDYWVNKLFTFLDKKYFY